MRESRLFQIIYYILEKGRATAPELAKKFEVSVRTIYRDVDVISSAGIPVYVSTGRNGGIQILDGYVLEKVLFSEQEKQDFRLFKLNRIVSCELLEETLRRFAFLIYKGNLPRPLKSSSFVFLRKWHTASMMNFTTVKLPCRKMASFLSQLICLMMSG